MSEQTRLKLMCIAVCFGVIGFIAIIKAAGVWCAAGVLLVIWGDNISKSLRKSK